MRKLTQVFWTCDWCHEQDYSYSTEEPPTEWRKDVVLCPLPREPFGHGPLPKYDLCYRCYKKYLAATHDFKILAERYWHRVMCLAAKKSPPDFELPWTEREAQETLKKLALPKQAPP